VFLKNWQTDRSTVIP